MVPIHLWGFHASESACSTPCQRWRHSGSSMAEPAIAASTCSQIPYRLAMMAMASTGSIAVVAVAPTEQTIAAGTLPAARSRSMAAARAPGSIALV